MCCRSKHKQEKFLRKHILSEKCCCYLERKKWQNWKVQGNEDGRHLKSRQASDIAIHKMRFARRSCQFRLECGDKSGGRMRVYGEGSKVSWLAKRHLGLLLLEFTELFSYIWVWTKHICLTIAFLIFLKYFLWYRKTLNVFLFPVTFPPEFSSWFLS